MTTLTEADVEAAALSWLAGLGWQVARGPEIAPERATYAGRKRGLLTSTMPPPTTFRRSASSPSPRAGTPGGPT